MGTLLFVLVVGLVGGAVASPFIFFWIRDLFIENARNDMINKAEEKPKNHKGEWLGCGLTIIDGQQKQCSEFKKHRIISVQENHPDYLTYVNKYSNLKLLDDLRLRLVNFPEFQSFEYAVASVDCCVGLLDKVPVIGQYGEFLVGGFRQRFGENYDLSFTVFISTNHCYLPPKTPLPFKTKGFSRHLGESTGHYLLLEIPDTFPYPKVLTHVPENMGLLRPYLSTIPPYMGEPSLIKIGISKGKEKVVIPKPRLMLVMGMSNVGKTRFFNKVTGSSAPVGDGLSSTTQSCNHAPLLSDPGVTVCDGKGYGDSSGETAIETIINRLHGCKLIETSDVGIVLIVNPDDPDRWKEDDIIVRSAHQHNVELSILPSTKI
jgi:hypothetical protein